MKVSIVTPSFRHSDWLKLCIASVADQQGVDVEHIIQDAGSDDGTLEWLLADKRVKAYVEKDDGMYDAVNRGLRKAKGDVLAYLNCDEQYFPGALRAVCDYFTAHPDVDVLFGDTILVDPEGWYICQRQVVTPKLWQIRTSGLQTLTAAMFFRKRVIEEHGLLFDPGWKELGDVFWVLSLLEAGLKTAVLSRFTSSFTESGANMSLVPNAQKEADELFKTAPRRLWLCRHLLVVLHRLRRLAAGHYSLKPHRYEIYTAKSPDKRVCFNVDHPTFKWHTRYTGFWPKAWK